MLNGKCEMGDGKWEMEDGKCEKPLQFELLS